jgi:hypothetical protein
MSFAYTPTDILKNEIDAYKRFIRSLETKNGIDPNMPQERIDWLTLKSEEKIIELEAAITKLEVF